VKVEQVGHAALEGWRERVADAVGPRVAERSPLRESQVRTALGLLFLALAVKYLAGTTQRLLGRR
jgi:hypothetical protein